MSSRRNRGGGGGGHGGGGEERWLLPYADMITLLLGLFIVLFAMSSIDAKQFDQVRQSLSQTFRGSTALDGSSGVLPGSNGVLNPTAPSSGKVDAVVSTDIAARTQAQHQVQEQFDRETERLQQLQQQLGLGKDLTVNRTEVGIQISIAGDALFPSGSYQLSAPGIRTELTRIEKELARFNRNIRIEGHTDGAPMAGEFGNQGLSTNRANAVWKFFRDKGFPEKLMYTVGMGDTHPKVKPPRPTASVAANRRIEIIVLEPGTDGTGEGTSASVVPRTGAATGPGRSSSSPSASARAQIARSAAPTASDRDPLVDQIAATGGGRP